MGTNYFLVKKKPTIREPLHIGKSSAGWKFLFQEVKGCEYDYNLQISTFPQWKEYLEKHVRERQDMIILNEYDEEVLLEDLLELIEEKQKTTNENDFTYSKNVDGYRFTEGDFS